MKTIEFKTGTVLGREVSTVDLMKILLDTAPLTGYKRSDYKMCDAIEKKMEDALEAKSNSFPLEENEFKYLCGIIDYAKWGTREKLVKDFVNLFILTPTSL